MRKLKSSILRNVIFVMMAVMITVSFTACGSSNNKEIQSRYKVNVEKQTNEFYVNDFANLLSEKDKQVMMSNAIELAETFDGIQVVVTTVNSLNGNGIEEYAYSMYEQYEIGKDSMGILILLAVEDRDVRIETGKKMQTYITDSQSGRLLDKYGMEYFKKNQFAKGLKSVQQAVISEIKSIVPIDWNGQEKNELVTIVVDPSKQEMDNRKESSTKTTRKNDRNGVVDMIFAVLLVSIIILISKSWKMKEKKEKLLKQVKELEAIKKNMSQKIEQLTYKCLKYQLSMESMESRHTELNEQIGNIKREKEMLFQEMVKIQENYQRICKLHPECDFEKEIQDMIARELKEAALNLDSKINAIINIPPNRSRVKIFKDVIDEYENAQEGVKEAVTADIQSLNRLYQESVRIQKAFEEEQQQLLDKKQARNIFDKMKKVYQNHPKGKYDDYDDLYKVYMLYMGLTPSQKKYFPDKEMLGNYEMILEKAKQAKRNYDKACQAEKEAQDAIRFIYDSADKDDMDTISEAFKIYKKLTKAQKVYFSAELLKKMKKLKKQAENDYENYKRERQEDTNLSFDYSFGNSSNVDDYHSGFGGDPSGGGASRHF